MSSQSCVCVCGLTEGHFVSGSLKRGGQIESKAVSEPRRIAREGGRNRERESDLLEVEERVRLICSSLSRNKLPVMDGLGECGVK